MIVRLFCPKCAYEASKHFDGQTEIEVPVPVSRLSDNGQYEVHCGKGHVSTVVLDNVKFELLFEMGLNAIVDGYPKEAVSSFASALERFYEFYWRVAMHHFNISKEQIEKAWKPLSKLSERQIGAYSTAVTLLTKEAPSLLNPNKHVPFRNKVIHSGYVPTEEEAISFGDTVKQLIEDDLDKLRQLASDSLESVYQELSPRDYEEKPEGNDDSEILGCVNILTAIDVRHPPKSNDKRFGSVSDQFQRIVDDRQPIRMQMLSEEEIKKRFPENELPTNTQG